MVQRNNNILRPRHSHTITHIICLLLFSFRLNDSKASSGQETSEYLIRLTPSAKPFPSPAPRLLHPQRIFLVKSVLSTLFTRPLSGFIRFSAFAVPFRVSRQLSNVESKMILEKNAAGNRTYLCFPSKPVFLFRRQFDFTIDGGYKAFDLVVDGSYAFDGDAGFFGQSE